MVSHSLPMSNIFDIGILALAWNDWLHYYQIKPLRNANCTSCKSISPCVELTALVEPVKACTRGANCTYPTYNWFHKPLQDTKFIYQTPQLLFQPCGGLESAVCILQMLVKTCSGSASAVNILQRLMKADRVSASKLGAPRRVMKAGSGRTVLVGPLQVAARLLRREITPIKTLTGFISGANSTCRASSSIHKPLRDAIYLWAFAGYLKHLYQCSQASAGTKRNTRLTTSIYEPLIVTSALAELLPVFTSRC